MDPELHTGPLEEIGWITGEGSPNRTGSRFAVLATDLGICWPDGRGAVFVSFGDSYGEGWGGRGAGPREADWRCNLLARAPLEEPVDTLTLTEMIEDAPGHAAQVIARDPTLPEETVIPTAGIAVGDVQYQHYMSVRAWHGPGRWRTNYGAIAYSTDHGCTWHTDGPRWVNHSPRWGRAGGGAGFQLAAFVRDGDDVLMFGTPNGRFGPARLARVPATDLLDETAWRYWTGSGWHPYPSKAAPVIPAPVAELSVLWHEPTRRWIALSLDEHQAAITLRTARNVVGPWSEPRALVRGSQYPGLYGGFLHPCSALGDRIYFTMSQWDPYNVLLMRTTLTA